MPVKKSPVGSTDISPTPVAPPSAKPGSEEWVYVNEPIPEVWCFQLKLLETVLSPVYFKVHAIIWNIIWPFITAEIYICTLPKAEMIFFLESTYTE